MGLEEGYLKLPSLSKEKCDSIVEHLKTLPFKGRNAPNIITGFKFEEKQSNIYEVMSQGLIQAIPEVKELATDPKLLSIIKEYLGDEPIQTQACCWWTVRYSNKLLSKCAQLFHQDHTYAKFIKLFLYLNDVTKDNGCHVYVPNSVGVGPQPSKRRLSSRVGDDFIEENYKEIKYIEGEKGTMTLVDTRGWHKGNPVKEGYRLLIQLEWTDNITHLATGRPLSYI